MLASGRALEGERKLVTVLFADVVGSMDLAERLGAEEWRQIVDRYFAILCEGIHRFEGMVDKFTGDGAMALFGAPLAQEDHAARACHAALRLLDRLRAYSAELRRRRGVDFAVRVGLNSGEVVTGAIGDDLTLQYTALGHDVGLAERIEALAAPGTALLSEHTAELVEGYFELRDLGERDIPGAREPVRVHELAGLGRMQTHLDVSRARGLSPFVGRSREMATLRSALASADAGSGQVIGLEGEAGVGKSRLCYELSESCRASGIEVWSAQCTSRGARQPLLLLRELLRSCFGITELDTDQAVRDKVVGRTALHDRPLEGDLPPLLGLLGDSDDHFPAQPPGSEERQRALADVLDRVLLPGPTDGPRVIVLEELRWIDPPSEGFVRKLVERLPATRTLLVASSRPEDRPAWLQVPYSQRLALQPLEEGAVEALLHHWLGTDFSVAGLAERIAERTGGNPFFIEELIRSLAESNRLVGNRGGYRMPRPIDDPMIPSSVETVLAARIDRLSESDRTVLQIAAVIGHEFTARLLGLVAYLPDGELRAALRALVAADFLVVRAPAPAARYAFKHHLTEEVAYRSELAERRAPIHAAVASALQELYPERLDLLAGVIAHHLEEAGERALAAPWSARAQARAKLTSPGEASSS